MLVASFTYQSAQEAVDYCGNSDQCYYDIAATENVALAYTSTENHATLTILNRLSEFNSLHSVYQNSYIRLASTNK